MGSVSVQIVAGVVTLLSLVLGVTAVVTRYWFQLKGSVDKTVVVADYGLWEVCASSQNNTVCYSSVAGAGFWIRVAQIDGVLYILLALGVVIATCVWVYRASRGMAIEREPKIVLTLSIGTVFVIATCAIVLFLLSANVKTYIESTLTAAGTSASFSQHLGYSCYLVFVAIFGHVAALIVNGLAMARTTTETRQFGFKTFA